MRNLIVKFNCSSEKVTIVMEYDKTRIEINSLSDIETFFQKKHQKLEIETEYEKSIVFGKP